jgi:hypothetical protein
MQRLFLIILVFCAGCSALRPPQTSTSPVNATQLLTPFESAAVEVTPTPTEYQGACSFVWGHQPLPEINSELAQVLREAGMNEVDVAVTAYGENCVDVSTNAIVRFSAQQTDFYFNIALADANDTRAMGQWVVLVLDILKEFPPGKVPGTNLGRVEIEFQDGSRSTVLEFGLEEGNKLVGQGLRGSALFETLLASD